VLYSLISKTQRIITGTKNALFFAIGSSSKLQKINLTAEQLKDSGAFQIGKIIILAACVDRRFLF
jgi:hypothetical protein